MRRTGRELKGDLSRLLRFRAEGQAGQHLLQGPHAVKGPCSLLVCTFRGEEALGLLHVGTCNPLLSVSTHVCRICQSRTELQLPALEGSLGAQLMVEHHDGGDMHDKGQAAQQAGAVKEVTASSCV